MEKSGPTYIPPQLPKPILSPLSARNLVCTGIAVKMVRMEQLNPTDTSVGTRLRAFYDNSADASFYMLLHGQAVSLRGLLGDAQRQLARVCEDKQFTFTTEMARDLHEALYGVLNGMRPFTKSWPQFKSNDGSDGDYIYRCAIDLLRGANVCISSSQPDAPISYLKALLAIYPEFENPHKEGSNRSERASLPF